MIAIDGRSGSGKSTLAHHLHSQMTNCAVVSTDAVAWNYSMFDWATELSDRILDPVRDGRSVDYQPPGWARHGRSGSIIVPTGLETLVIEGVGAGQHALADSINLLIWVQSDAPTARQLGIARDVEAGDHGDDTEATAFWDQWAAAEAPFLEREKPWFRADFIIAGTGATTTKNDHIVTAAVSQPA